MELEASWTEQTLMDHTPKVPTFEWTPFLVGRGVEMNGLMDDLENLAEDTLDFHRPRKRNRLNRRLRHHVRATIGRGRTSLLLSLHPVRPFGQRPFPQ